MIRSYSRKAYCGDLEMSFYRKPNVLHVRTVNRPNAWATTIAFLGGGEGGARVSSSSTDPQTKQDQGYDTESIFMSTTDYTSLAGAAVYLA